MAGVTAQNQQSPVAPKQAEIASERIKGAAADKEGEYLTFVLANEEFALEILKVREIIGYMDITSIPQTPDYVKGVINLRGQVIPVVDLRLKFGMGSIDITERTCIIVVEITQAAGLEETSSSLAMRSAEAARNTSGLIEESVKNSRNGVNIAGEVARVLEEIVISVGKTSELVGEIAAASAGQAQGIDQVNITVAQMDKVTQSNAANAEETASASEELSVQARQMDQVVEELAAMVGGTASATGGSKSCWGKEKSMKKMLNTSDNAFHQIARGTSRTPQKIKATAEKTIAFDDDGEGNIGGFNS